MKLRELGIGTRLFAVMALAIVVLLTSTILILRKSVMEEAVDSAVSRARAVTSGAISTLEFLDEMDSKSSLVDRGPMIEEAQQAIAGVNSTDERLEKLRSTTLYQMLPVVVAWTIAGENAKELGYEFRTPRRGARNPKNEPTEVESGLLSQLEAGDEEAWIIDPATQQLHFARAVRLSSSCMGCHGVPKDADDYLDVTGFEKEKRKIGDFHGAFEVISPMKGALDRAQAASMRILIIGLGIGSAALALLWFLIRKWLSYPLEQTSEALGDLASGRLDREHEIEGSGEVSIMAAALGRALDSLRSTLSGVASSTRRVVTASGEVSVASKKTADSSGEQSDMLVSTASSIQEISATVQVTAENSEKASELATKSQSLAEEGGRVAQEAIQAIEWVSESSEKIASINSTIDQIAFQTNLLSLNAAVEAARAGESGRGFAVVAEEVRSLALRSSNAASEISQLIDETLQRVRTGSDLVARTGRSLDEIVDSVGKVAEIVRELAVGAREQSVGVTQVSTAMGEMESRVQQSSRQAVDLARTAEDLDRQTASLQQLIANFTLESPDSIPGGGQILEGNFGDSSDAWAA